MEFDVSLDTEQQFWDEIQEILSAPCSSEDLIDNALRSYLGLSTKYKDEYLRTEYDVSRCLFKLFLSNIFVANADYVRRQIIYGLLQEDDPKTLLLIASFLLFDGRRNEGTLLKMNEEGAFPRLMELLQTTGRDDEAGLHRILMDLLYEMSRIQRMRIEDLVLVDDDFIKSLFGIIEDLSYDVNDPYHYPVIRVLLVMNEQFMISAHDPVDERSPNRLTNKVIKVLSMHGNLYKTFGENIILLINREAETSLQLLTLKLLYLIFTTPSTYEYFYTNDLRVLVDILIRSLLDLPEEASALRHTYLRVLYPLLAHTQLRHPPHYKRDELMKMLNLLVRGQFSDTEPDYEKILHFDEVDETTRRLVVRCATVDWLHPAEEAAALSVPSPDEGIPLFQPHSEPSQPTITETGPQLQPSKTISPAELTFPDNLSPTRDDESLISPATHKPNHAERLGMHLDPASTSSLSFREVASQHEKPGIITPSRNDTETDTAVAIQDPSPSPPKPTSSTAKPKIKPEPPKRRWRGRRLTVGEKEHPTTATALKPPEPAHHPTARRNSAGSGSSTASLVPPPRPIPAHFHGHAHRSASNPPPAVPPPRRSHVHVHHGDGTGNASPTSPTPAATQTTTAATAGGVGVGVSVSVQVSKQCHKPPEPPKTRRWGRGKRAQSEPKVKNAESDTVTVEEAVQNVSLESGREGDGNRG